MVPSNLLNPGGAGAQELRNMASRAISYTERFTSNAPALAAFFTACAAAVATRTVPNLVDPSPLNVGRELRIRAQASISAAHLYGGTVALTAFFADCAAKSGGSVTPVRQLVAMSHRLSTPNVPTPNTSNFRFFGQRIRISNRTDKPMTKLTVVFQNVIANSSLLVPGPSLQLEVGISVNTNVDNPSRVLLPLGGAGVTRVTMAGDAVLEHTYTLASPLAPQAYVDLFLDLEYATAPAVIPATNIISANYPNDCNEASADTRINKAGTGGITTRGAGARCVFGPVAVYGTSEGVVTTPRLLVIGDSIIVGANDTTAGAYNGGLQRSLAALYPWTSTAQAGYSWGQFTAANYTRTMAGAKGEGAYSHALAIMSTNDFAGGTGATAATIYGLMQARKTQLAALGMKMIVATPWPRTNAGNSAIPTGDNAAVWTRIQDLRTLLLANNGVGDGVLDINLAMRDATNINLWNTAISSDTGFDGIHPGTARHGAFKTFLDTALPPLLV